MALLQRPAPEQRRPHLPALTPAGFRLRQHGRLERLPVAIGMLARRYRGLEPDSTRTAWRCYLDSEPLDTIVAGIRPGQTLRFR